MKVRGRTGRAVGLLLLAALGACSASDSSFDGDYGTSSGSGGGSFSVSTTSGSSSSGAGGLPPEQELENKYQAPVSTGRYVWIANPTSGRVAYIDAETLEVKLVDAGDGPTYVARVPSADEDVAIVLNVLSSDATVLRASPGKAVKALSVPVPSNGNAWAVSPDGRFAIAWTNSALVDAPDPVDGYQDITVLDLAEGKEKAYPLTVGYRPVAVGFETSSDRAFAVTQDGVSVVALGGGQAPAVVGNISLGDSANDAPGTHDVAITPDGAYALVRRDGVSGVSVFSLDDGSRVDVALSSAPTDLDLLPDGSRAVAVLRDTQQIAILPIPDVVTDPTAVTIVDAGALVGSASLAPESSTALFYTNATPSSVLTACDVSQASPVARQIELRAPILAVFPTPDASNAIVLHDALDTEGSSYPAAISVTPVAADLPAKIVGLDAPVVSVAVTADHALIASGSSDANTYALTTASLPSLAVTTYPLASLPVAAGIVDGAHKGFVAQDHPDGRITFIDLDTGEARTITGFELASEVVDGSKP